MARTLANPNPPGRTTATAGGRKVGGATPRRTSRGIVRSWIEGPWGKHASPGIAAVRLIGALKSGLAVEELDDLRRCLDLPMDKLLPPLGLSKATFHRRKASGSLEMAESDRVLRFARLLGLAASALESLENGRRWFTSPQVGLGGATPLEFAETEVGAREVEYLLGRLEYGVYS